MSESYSVEAVLSARDEGFMAGMKAAEKASSSLGSKVKTGLGFGVFSAIGSKAVGAVTTGVTGLIGEMKSEWADRIGKMLELDQNISPSFQAFLHELTIRVA